MTYLTEQFFIVVLIGTVPYLLVLALALLALAIAIMPREHTRRLRHKLAAAVLWQWVRGSKISAIAHGWLWKNGNGHDRK